ncbi:MAG: glycoside hydrolase family 3 N-terminal domain-containing protein [Candidatus Metalachnospira sp.]|nr:glycoside hydrolase family 3 N-terminal domain-containing protein [Candidatus Metalachnospira sp.]
MKKLMSMALVIVLALGNIGCAASAADQENNNEGGKEVIVDRAQEILDTMTLEEKIGQMFFVRCPEENAANVVSQFNIGGYLLFARDFNNNTSEDVKNAISSYQKSSKVPLLIGVDEEGGTVNRISKFPAFRKTPFKSPQELYAEDGFNLIFSDTKEKCLLLKSLGVNVNLAPVCDVATDDTAFIYSRTLGKDAVTTSEYVTDVVSVMKAQQVGSALKHFPGYGNNGDTHTDIVTDSRTRDEFENNDFLPFEAGIAAGADIVLVSHNIVSAFDKDRPASLSQNIHYILRNELGFNGVIMTDDLSMEAIKQYIGDSEAAVEAVKAGNDLLCCSDYEIQIKAVIDAVSSGEIPAERIDYSAKKIIQMKLNLGLLK